MIVRQAETVTEELESPRKSTGKSPGKSPEAKRPPQAEALADRTGLTSNQLANEGLAERGPTEPKPNEPDVKVGLQTTQRRLLRESVWVVGGRVLGIGTAIGINVLLARILPPADVGIFFLLASILTFAGFAAMFGLNASLVRFVAESIGLRDPERARRVLKQGTQLAVASLSIGGLACFAFLMLSGESLFGIPNVATIAPLLAVCVIASATLQICGSLLRSFHDSRLSIMLTGQFGGPVSNLIFIGLAIGLYLIATPTLSQIMLLSAVSMCVLMPIAIFALYQIGKRRLNDIDVDPQKTSERITFYTLLLVSLPLMLTQCLSYVTGQADIWIAGANVQHEDLALYGAARRLMLIVGMPMQLVNLTVIASIAELRAQGRLKDLQKILRTSASIAAVPALLVWIPMMLFPAQISAIVFGDYYADGANVLRILTIGAFVYVAVGAAELTLMMSGQHKTALAVNVCTSLLLCIGGLFATQQWGIVGLAIAWSAVVSLQCISFCVFARINVGVWTALDVSVLWKWREVLADYRNQSANSPLKTP